MVNQHQHFLVQNKPVNVQLCGEGANLVSTKVNFLGQLLQGCRCLLNAQHSTELLLSQSLLLLQFPLVFLLQNLHVSIVR